MANKEDIRQRSLKVSPQITVLSDKIDKLLAGHGFKGNIVTLTEDMTLEEEEMAIFEGLLKEGYSADEAEAKAKKDHEIFRKVFGY